MSPAVPMASLDGAGNLVCMRPGTTALTMPSARSLGDSFFVSGRAFCNGNDNKGRCQSSVDRKLERAAPLQVEEHTRTSVLASNQRRTYEPSALTRGAGQSHSRRTRRCAVPRHCKVCRSSPSLTSDDSQQGSGIEHGRELEQSNAAPGIICTKAWSDDRAEFDAQDDSNVSTENSPSPRGIFVNGHPSYHESPDSQVGTETNGRGGSRRHLELRNDDALLTVEGFCESHKTGDLSQAAEKELENKVSGTPSVSQLDFRVEGGFHDASVLRAGVEELVGKALNSSTDTISQAIQGNGSLATTTQTRKNSQLANDDTGTCETGAIPKATGFWQIVKNDMEFLAQSFKWAQKVALPSLAERAEEVATLRLWEDNSAFSARESQSLRASYPDLSGLDLLAADSKVLKAYINNSVGWFMAWRIPLKQLYEPEMIANYFNRRPHVLLFRILQVSAVFGYVIIRIESDKFLKGITGSKKQIPGDEENVGIKEAELIKEALVKLGPSFIKVGQSLSTRPDLVGQDMAKILAELQDSLPPFPTPQAVAIIENELGRPLNEIFSHLSKTPVAAASFGQVYKGITLDGQEVAVKVQRPNLLHSIALDIYILRLGLAALREIAKRRSDLKLYADELGQGFFGELDYRREAENAAEFQEAHAKLKFLQVPKTIACLSTSRVLTMEWIDGDRPVDLLLTARALNPDGDFYVKERQMRAKQRLFALVNKGVEASLVQLLDTGILHADPHPGNLLYTEEGQMVFLDFGLLCRMEKHHQLAMLASVAHIVNADWKNFVVDLADMEVLPRDIDRTAITLELEEALGVEIPLEGIPDIKFSKILVKVLAIALKHHFKMPPYFILVLRSIASLEGLALAVDPDFKVFAASYPFVLQRLLTDKSVHLRNILLSLVLNEEKEFRWDRLASFASLARQHTMKRVALETGMDLQNLSVSAYNMTNTNPDLIPLLVNLLLSKDGSILRRLILEADTAGLACAFNSSKAAIFRRQAATSIANVFYQYGKGFLKEHIKLAIQDSVEYTQPLPSSSEQQSQQAIIASGKKLTDEVKSLVNCSDTLDSSLLRSRQLWFLLRTAVARLSKKPLLLLNTGWSLLIMFCYAIAVTAHRLAVGISCKCFVPQIAARTRTSNQLIPA